MKKTIVYTITIFMLSFFVGIIDARADFDTAQKYIDDKSAILLCEYIDEDTKEIESRIYYYFQEIGNTIGPWEARRRSNTGWPLYKDRGLGVISTSGTANTPLTKGNFSYVFGSKSKATNYGQANKHMEDSMENTFTCPANAFLNGDNNGSICYGPYESCGDKYEKGPYRLNTTTSTIFTIIDEYAKTLLTSDEIVSIARSNGNFLSTIRSKTKEHIKANYSIGTKYEFPKFIENYIDNLSLNTEEHSEALKAAIDTQITEDLNAGKITEEQAASEKNKNNNKDYSSSLGTAINTHKPLNINDDPNCNGLLGTDGSKLVNNLFKFVQYLGPILIAVLSVMDFAKAAVSGDDGQMKKSASRLAKRIVCGILLFFIPLICSFLLNLGGIKLTDTCITRYGTTETQK